ncbi:hypothetical protein [Oryzobacter telluris]|uniref:hypothetical protein n=1 Tax=Oryzobacter telluris TaxID=3149179 RepID=UPI00370D3870
MSVDERLRAGLEREALEFDPTTGRGLDGVVSVARRRRTVRRLAAGLAAAVVVAGVVGLGLGRATPAAVPAAPVPTMSALERLEADHRLSTALVGRWSTTVLDEADVVATLGRAGMGQHAAVVLGDIPLPVPVVITFDERRYRTTFGSEEADLGSWHVKDGRLVLVPSCGLCRMVFAPTLKGGTLRLTLLEDPSPDYLGIPDAAFGVVVYTALPFERTPS